MENKEYYKLMQVSDILISKYGFTQVVLKQFNHLLENEIWLINPKDINYQLIRITNRRAAEFIYEKHINDYINYSSSAFKLEKLSFLDIHISNESHLIDNEPYDYLNLEEEYSDGVDVSKIYPEIYSVVKHSNKPDEVINRVLNNMKNVFNSRLKNRPFLLRHPTLVTNLIIIVCIINYLLGLYLKTKYNDTSAIFVFLGADYKTFTLGLKQFYRLITYAFVHSDIIHLACNMISLYSIGKYVEKVYGHLRYSIILFFSIIVGGLTQGILADNSICLGMSAGIYGILVVFIMDIVRSRIINIRQLMPTIFINLFLNFLSTTAWMAHLGGAIGGFVLYYLFQNQKDYKRIVLCIVLILALVIKYISISKIKSLYLGTDFNVLQILSDFGLDKTANRLAVKLIDVYNTLGG